MIQTTQELAQKDKELKLIVEESYNVPEAFSEIEYDEIFNLKMIFLTTLIENLEILTKNYDQKHFDNFYRLMSKEFEKAYGVTLPTRFKKDEPKKKEEIKKEEPKIENKKPIKIDTNYEKK